MAYLEIKDLKHTFQERTLYSDVNLEIHKGEHVGIVGQNGAGKSTFMNFLTGAIPHDEGIITWQRNLDIGHLDQYAKIELDLTIENYLKLVYHDLYELEKRMNQLYIDGASDHALLNQAASIQERLMIENFYDIDTEINKVVQGLGIAVIGVDSPLRTLSGGQRAKVILAKLLLSKPDVLLLDEPTNFLDLEHVLWLGDYLKNFDGTFLVISHDTDFLSTITTTILDIEFGSIKKYHGNYSSFIKQKAHLRKEYISTYTKQQAHIEKTEAYIRKNKAGVNSKMARGRQKQLDRLERIKDPQINAVARFRFKDTNLSSHRLLRVENLVIGYDTPLLDPLNFELLGGEKIVITGFNGIGKSTLIKTLTNEIQALSGHYEFTDSVSFGYFEQDTQWAKNIDTPLQHLFYYFPDHTEKTLRQTLATCGVKADHVTRSINTLSGGEQAKVKLAHLILTESNLLIMDEPTNHLDIETKEVLQTALKAFNGSVILVSHEKEFYDGWIDRIIKI